MENGLEASSPKRDGIAGRLVEGNLDKGPQILEGEWSPVTNWLCLLGTALQPAPLPPALRRGTLRGAAAWDSSKEVETEQALSVKSSSSHAQHQLSHVAAACPPTDHHNPPLPATHSAPHTLPHTAHPTCIAHLQNCNWQFTARSHHMPRLLPPTALQPTSSLIPLPTAATAHHHHPPQTVADKASQLLPIPPHTFPYHPPRSCR